MLDRMVYTLNPKAEISGPVFKDESSKSEKDKYGTDLIRIILEEAHKKAKTYLDKDDPKAYYSFMVLALTVPMHEGLYIHFRKAETDPVCNENANSGELVKANSEDLYKIFNQYLKSGEVPFLANCQDVLNETALTQVVRGADGSDFGVMQLSIKWHFDTFLAKGKYKSVRDTVAYGVSHLMNGFKVVYANISDYECLYTKKNIFSKKVINYKNIVRGIWGGKYNSGSVALTCRFADPESPYKKFDEGFNSNLDKVLSFDKSKGTVGYNSALSFELQGDVRSALGEIIDNFNNEKDERSKMTSLLTSSI